MRKRPGWDGLNNNVIFTWGFLEMLLWFWVSDDIIDMIPKPAGSTKAPHTWANLQSDICHSARRAATPCA